MTDARTAIRRQMSEADFQAQVKQEAALRGWSVYHTFDSRRSDKGFPDLILVRGDTMLALELKARGREATEEQREWLRVLGEVVHVRSYVCHPEDLELISKWLT